MNWIAKVRSKALVKNTGWMFAGQGLKTAIQAAYFILGLLLLSCMDLRPAFPLRFRNAALCPLH